MINRQPNISDRSNNFLMVALLLVMFLPLALYGFFERNVYFPSRALIGGALVAALLTPVLVSHLLRRRYRLEVSGRISGLSIGQKSRIPISAFVILYEWCLVVFACSPLLSQNEQTEHTYLVSSAKQCTWKCSRCNYEVWVENWPGALASPLCADGVTPRPTVNQKLLVRGYFSKYAIYISGLSSGS